MSINKSTTVTIHAAGGEVKTDMGVLGAAMVAAGIVSGTPSGTPNNTTPADKGKGRRRIVAPAAKPASVEELAKQLAALKPAATPSVVVPAKKESNHSDVTIHITKEVMPGDESKKEYLCISRVRLNSDGQYAPDDKMNFGFDKSYSYHNGKARGNEHEWKLKKVTKEIGGVKGTFWCRYVPMNAVELLLKGLRENFSGATLVIDDKPTVL